MKRITATVLSVLATITTADSAFAVVGERRIGFINESEWSPRAECYDLPNGEHGINIYFKPQIKIQNYLNGFPVPILPVKPHPTEAVVVSLKRIRTYRTDLPVSAHILSDTSFSSTNREAYNSIAISTADRGPGTHYLGLPFRAGLSIVEGISKQSTFFSAGLNLDPGSNMGGRSVVVTWTAKMSDLGLNNKKWDEVGISSRTDVFSCPGQFNESMRGYKPAVKRSTQQFLGLVK